MEKECGLCVIVQRLLYSHNRSFCRRGFHSSASTDKLKICVLLRRASGVPKDARSQ